LCARPELFGVLQAAIASKLAPKGRNSRQNSKVLDNVTCRESPIDTKNRLAAEV
jgi:hypothetical protein